MDILADYSVAWILGFVIALLLTGVAAGLMAGLLGVGGGIVIVPVLFHLFTLLGIDESVRMHLAVGTSLATIVPTSIISARAHYIKGSLDKSLLKPLIPGVVLGVLLGTALSMHVSGGVLTAVFAVVALLVALNMAFKQQGFQIASQLPGTMGTGLIGCGIGSLSSMMGIGGGTLSVPILSAFKTPMHTAVGTGAALGIIISIPGTLGFLISGIGIENRPPLTLGYINLVALALIVPVTMKMAPIGAGLAHRLDAGVLRKLFALFLCLTSLKMFYSLTNGL